MLDIATITAYIFSVVSFILFVYSFLIQQPKRVRSRNGDSVEFEQQGALSEIAQLVEAVAKLTDSLAKAGPLVMTLVATIFFLLVALVGSGFDAVLASSQ